MGVVGFFGYKDISTIDEKINKSVAEKIKEKSDEFIKIYEKNIQGLTDQALITAYSIQFAAPPKRFERPTILSTHLQRFVQLLADQATDSKIIDSLYDLLSDPAHDGNSAIVNNKLLEIVAGAGTFGWIKNDSDRLSRSIDLLASRSVSKNPAAVRSYLAADQTPPGVLRSAVYYAARTGDRLALPLITKLFGEGNRSPPEEVLFAIVLLDPNSALLADWMTKLKTLAANSEQLKESQEKIILAARVASSVIEFAGAKGRSSLRGIDPETIKFGTTTLELLFGSGAHVALDLDSFGNVNDSANLKYEIMVSWPN